MVGGLADWFAVVAIFRHPLGVPIPHTAIIPERKEQFGETLGDFIQTSFLTPDAVVERVRPGRRRRAARRVGWPTRPTPTGSPATSPTAPSRSPTSSGRRTCTSAFDGIVRQRLESTPVGPAGRPRPRGRHPGRAPRRAGRRRPRRPGPLPRRAPGRAPRPVPGQGAVVAARRGRGPHLRAPPRRRPHRARRHGPPTRPRPAPAPRRAHRPAGPRPPDLTRAAGPRATASPTTSSSSRSCGPGRPGCGRRPRPPSAPRPPIRGPPCASSWPRASPGWASGCWTSRRCRPRSRPAPRRACATWSCTSAARSPSW